MAVLVIFIEVQKFGFEGSDYFQMVVTGDIGNKNISPAVVNSNVITSSNNNKTKDNLTKTPRTSKIDLKPEISNNNNSNMPKKGELKFFYLVITGAIIIGLSVLIFFIIKKVRNK